MLTNNKLFNCIHFYSKLYEGFPYIENPLNMDAHSEEKLILRQDKFDSLTFIETVLALSFANLGNDFEGTLQNLRYQNGILSWKTRNHFFIDWIKNNARRKIITKLYAPKGVQNKYYFIKKLDVIEGIPTRQVHLTYFPEDIFEYNDWVKKNLKAPAIVAFGSTKANLDFYHMGLVFLEQFAEEDVGDNNNPKTENKAAVDDTFVDESKIKPHKLTLYHASKEEGRVISEDFKNYIQNHDMSGIVLAKVNNADMWQI